ncbi:hypothetical protein HPB48_021014 [Haemaphysalis longicornis]|uniref:Uncharacterized protein n=1 Tax=Haemaphysalis longicornis TaxID=44386 RepID=A0A9J6GXX2_HAELO|nr:hypothetical protein HPB48_021014 [Haemaphysalis longicornis]
MIGFRAYLSTQYAMLHIQADILSEPPVSDNTAILALDRHKHCDNVFHHAILDSVSHNNLGSRTHTYTTTFLFNRTTRLCLGSLLSITFRMPSLATPVGAVLSPLTFNVAMTPLARVLEHTPNLRSVKNAEDITLWVRSSRDAVIRDPQSRSLYRTPPCPSCRSLLFCLQITITYNTFPAVQVLLPSFCS